MTEVFIALGSNLGDRLENLARSISTISCHAQNVLLKVSNIYETDPVGITEQARFLNAVVQIKTAFNPSALLEYLQVVELQFGRKREYRWGPRTLDLDVLAIENLYYNSPRLKIPHPELRKRLFVLRPFADIAPHYEIFGADGDVETYMDQVDKSSSVDFYLSSKELMKLSREE